MKKNFIFAGCVVTLLIGACLTQSCNIDEDTSTSRHDVPITEADMVVASPEYVAYRKALEVHSKKVHSAYVKLSSKEKEEVKAILTRANEEVGIDVFAEVGTILKYDIKASLAKVDKLRNAVDFRGVMPADFVRALYRAPLNLINTRSSSKEDMKTELYKLCCDKCITEYEYAKLQCEYNNDTSDHTHDQDCGYDQYGYCSVEDKAEIKENDCKIQAETKRFQCENECYSKWL